MHNHCTAACLGWAGQDYAYDEFCLQEDMKSIMDAAQRLGEQVQSPDMDPSGSLPLEP